ncbi:MAG: histidine--tRNA ligase [Patescibacteria group bacterium]|nr:histidine--tRNA ligase [Patescibacteria group bacterium]MCX7589936.1 histidine--tRNA ligase [Patescibacteria group bacterium]MDW8279786.1 histidine--tRNA ligase [bacterium]
MRKKNKKILLQTPKGMHDILPSDEKWYDRIYKAFRKISEFYGFKKISTPILEYAFLFEKGIGEATDIIEKEMYFVKTKGDDLLALRPEGTAPVMRAYFEHGFNKLSQPQKFYYFGPFFRHENPQAGRFRQFHQLGFEIIGGKSDSIYDAEIISLSSELIKELKISNLLININSIGCQTCRPKYIKKLEEYYKHNSSKVCKTCNLRIKRNPLRVLDCKDDKCQDIKKNAPNIIDSLCISCRNHFKEVLEYLDELNISYNLDQNLVRGLDYYSRTVFELEVEGLGSEIGSLGGGGRYDYLSQLLGENQVSALGAGLGIERLIYVMKAQQVKLPEKQGKKVFIIHLGDLAKRKTLLIMQKLYDAGVSFVETQDKESLKAQLRSANKVQADLALIIGQKEVFDNTVIIRDMHSGLQETIPLNKLTEGIKKYIKNI